MPFAHYEEALRLKPDFAEATTTSPLPSRKDPAGRCIVHYEEAVHLKPDYAEAHNNLANALAEMPGGCPKAIAHYETTLRLKADYAEAHYNFAVALAKFRAGWLTLSPTAKRSCASSRFCRGTQRTRHTLCQKRAIGGRDSANADCAQLDPASAAIPMIWKN